MNQPFKFNLTDKVKQILATEARPLTSRSIAKLIQERFKEDCAYKLKISENPNLNWDGLEAQLQAEIGARRHDMRKAGISVTLDRPMQYYLEQEGGLIPARSANQVIAQTARNEGEDKVAEKNLYPLLANYAAGLGIYAKRINEAKSGSPTKGAHKWTHPDMIGFKSISTEDKAVSFLRNRSNEADEWWSFEVKIKLTIGNVRESFFQALSNSSWAHYGYLVATEINEDAFEELELLWARHGIGFILLNLENPAESENRIQAKRLSELDWGMMDKIASNNKDYAKAMQDVQKYYSRLSVKEEGPQEAFQGWDNYAVLSERVKST